MGGLDNRERTQVAVGVAGAAINLLLGIWVNLLLLVAAALFALYGVIALRSARRRIADPA